MRVVQKKRKIKAQRKEEEIKMQRRLASFFKPTVSKSTTFKILFRRPILLNEPEQELRAHMALVTSRQYKKGDEPVTNHTRHPKNAVRS